MPEPALQRKCACGGACPRCKSGGSHLGPAAAPPIIHEALRSSGQLLDSATRAYFEPRFGHDFGDVRVHSDALAAQSADAVHALAFTVGQDIVFAAGRYRPETPGGRRLLAHELTHVVQQAGQTTGAQPQLEVAPPGDRFEQEAERVAEAIAGAGPALGQRIEGVMGPSDVDPEEESLAQPLSGAGPLPGGLSSIGFLGRRRLQRAASFKAGKVHVARNAAVQIATGGVAGVTLPVLNGKIFKNAAGAQAAIKAPTIARRSTATGAECWIKAVPTNTGSFDETVLTSGPWTTTTTRSNAWDRLGVAECLVANPGNARLTAKGDRTDADVAAANRTHEDRHATDDEKVFNAVVVPWDTAMTKASRAVASFLRRRLGLRHSALRRDGRNAGHHRDKTLGRRRRRRSRVPQDCGRRSATRVRPVGQRRLQHRDRSRQAVAMRRDPAGSVASRTDENEREWPRLSRQAPAPTDQSDSQPLSRCAGSTPSGPSPTAPGESGTTWPRLAWTGPVVTGDFQEFGIDLGRGVGRAATPTS